MLLLLLLFAACNSINKNMSFADKNNSKDSLEWVGTYEGTLPFADCRGMETKLILNQDKTYVLNTVYFGKSDDVIDQKGSFQWNDDGNRIKLKIDREPSLDHHYIFIENGLLKLDRQGNKVSGSLEDE